MPLGVACNSRYDFRSLIHDSFMDFELLPKWLLNSCLWWITNRAIKRLRTILWMIQHEVNPTWFSFSSPPSRWAGVNRLHYLHSGAKTVRRPAGHYHLRHGGALWPHHHLRPDQKGSCWEVSPPGQTGRLLNPLQLPCSQRSTFCTFALRSSFVVVWVVSSFSISFPFWSIAGF